MMSPEHSTFSGPRHCGGQASGAAPHAMIVALDGSAPTFWTVTAASHAAVASNGSSAGTKAIRPAARGSTAPGGDWSAVEGPSAPGPPGA